MTAELRKFLRDKTKHKLKLRLDAISFEHQLGIMNVCTKFCATYLVNIKMFHWISEKLNLLVAQDKKSQVGDH